MTTHAQPADTAPASRKRSRTPKRGSQNASVSVAKMGMIGTIGAAVVTAITTISVGGTHDSGSDSPKGPVQSSTSKVDNPPQGSFDQVTINGCGYRGHRVGLRRERRRQRGCPDRSTAIGWAILGRQRGCGQPTLDAGRCDRTTCSGALPNQGLLPATGGRARSPRRVVFPFPAARRDTDDDTAPRADRQLRRAIRRPLLRRPGLGTAVGLPIESLTAGLNRR